MTDGQSQYLYGPSHRVHEEITLAKQNFDDMVKAK